VAGQDAPDRQHGRLKRTGASVLDTALLFDPISKPFRRQRQAGRQIARVKNGAMTCNLTERVIVFFEENNRSRIALCNKVQCSPESWPRKKQFNESKLRRGMAMSKTEPAS
jgi:hypothetical protein